jgi:O-succinylbenzoic acid--CoA ligase
MHATYGLTEATSQVATAAPDELRERPGTSGRVLPGVVATIDDGEIVVSGPTVAGGRCATGDVGRIDANGFLFVEGRRDDRITTGGAKVDPARVEAAIRALDGVSDAAVVGVPDHEWGQRVVAAVVADTSEAALRAACRTVLAAHEVPRQFLFVEALPRTDNGKLQRAKLRSALQATTPT